MTAPLYRSPPTLLQYLSFASLFLLGRPGHRRDPNR